MEQVTVTLEEILKSREERASLQQSLLLRFHCPVVSATMNVAGNRKDSTLIRKTFVTFLSVLEEKLSGVSEPALYRFLKTGPECLIPVRMDPEAVKRLLVSIEESSPAGRLLDLDVIAENSRPVLRTALGYPERGCVICGKPGRICAAGRLHAIEEVIEKQNDLMCEALFGKNIKKISEKAVDALIKEVNLTPKPGLVDRNNSGSHRDMDLPLMEKSAKSLRDYFEFCVKTGLVTGDLSPEETFVSLRKEGLLAEKTMFGVTGGVNTHKGAVYLFGILLGAIGRKLLTGFPTTDEILSESQAVCQKAVAEDLMRIREKDPAKRTAGEKAYVCYGLAGARQEAGNGFPSLKNLTIPMLRERCKTQDVPDEALIRALLTLVASGLDTNMISRGGIEKARAAAAKAGQLLSDDPLDLLKVKRLDEDYISENLSPGGSADLLAATIFLFDLETDQSFSSSRASTIR